MVMITQVTYQVKLIEINIIKKLHKEFSIKQLWTFMRYEEKINAGVEYQKTATNFVMICIV